MKYRTKILAIDDEIDEMVVISIGDHRLTCFASVCPFRISVGDECLVDLNAYFIGDPRATPLPMDVPDGIERMNQGFAYTMIGRLKNSRFLVSGLTLDCEDLASMLEEINGGKWKVVVDRLDVEFLENYSLE